MICDICGEKIEGDYYEMPDGMTVCVSFRQKVCLGSCDNPNTSLVYHHLARQRPVSKSANRLRHLRFLALLPYKSLAAELAEQTIVIDFSLARLAPHCRYSLFPAS